MNKKRLTLAAVLILVFLGFGSFYSDRVSGESQNIYVLEGEKARLAEEVQALELNLSREQSLESINQRALDFGMTTQQDTWYIKPSESLSLR